MHHCSRVIRILTIMFIVIPLHWAHADLKNTFKGFQTTAKSDSTGLSDDTIVRGLKEALGTGMENVVAMVSRQDGYYRNPEIKIPLPKSIQKVEKLLRSVGFGSKVDQFELSMNRAAEKAAPQALSLFAGTIKGMSFESARKILNGRENEATLYFKEKTKDELTRLFGPIIHDSMAQVGVTKTFQELSAKTASIPFAGSLNMDPDTYVTEGALNGLFLMLEHEEQKIRQDPGARVTDLLKTVFTKKP